MAERGSDDMNHVGRRSMCGLGTVQKVPWRWELSLRTVLNPLSTGVRLHRGRISKYYIATSLIHCTHPGALHLPKWYVKGNRLPSTLEG
jgi:hypothetical protein